MIPPALFFSPHLRQLQKMWLEAEGSHVLRFPAKRVPLFFHLVFIILPHQRKECQKLLLQEKQCVGVTKGNQAGGFLKKGEISLFAPYRQKAMATLDGAGLTE